ncbi:MAG: 4Fe-4S ferredoxin [Desulfobulbaceae bacterium]|nr:MAG: 4Fe-4S ferredoxin [Desulfobulbaceae bacterium]
MMTRTSFRQQMPRLRLTVQLLFLAFTLWMGWRFYLFYQWSRDLGPYTPRPAAVEGFLPIGALVSLKRLLMTGVYDQVHPAGLTIFLAALSLGLLARKGFCGWICPVGAVSNAAEKVSQRLKILCKLPIWLDLPLRGLKYLLLGFFAYLILWRMPLAALEGFMESPYYLTADGRMLLFFLEPSTLALTVTLVIVAVSIIFRNFWCRFLCPYGALLGILAWPGPFALRRREELCIRCHRCSEVCPAEIPVHTKETVRSPECIGCLECAALCPVDDCLRLTAAGRTTSLWLLPVIVLGLFFAFYGWARLTGHWQGTLDDQSLKNIYRMVLHQP